MARPCPAGWREAAESLGEVVRQLGTVPAGDVATWRAVASDAAGALAVLSGRLERTPGPLALASGLLARSAQGPRPEQARVGYAPRGTLKQVAVLMAQADLDEEAPIAWRLLFSQLLRVAQAVHDAHSGRLETEQAARLAGEARSALEEARGRSSSLATLQAELGGLAAPAPEAADEQGGDRERRRRGQGGQRPEGYAALSTRRARPGQTQRSERAR